MNLHMIDNIHVIVLFLMCMCVRGWIKCIQMWLQIFTMLHKALVKYTNSYYDSLTIDGNLGTKDLEKRVKFKGIVSSWIDPFQGKLQKKN